MSAPSDDDPDGLSPADRRVADRIAALPPDEPAPGWEDRAIERARREGVIGPRRIAAPSDVLALIYDAASRLPGDTADYEALVDHLAPAVLGVPGLLAEATVRAYADPLLGPLVIAAARAYVNETREVDAAMAADEP